jgi:hypothetical protein
MTEAHLAGTDQGYAFLGPQIVARTMPLANGLTLQATHQSGVLVAQNPAGPLYQATLYAQGTTVLDTQSAALGAARLYEFTGSEGDSAWAIGLNWPDSPGTYRLVQGTGKWEGIGGTFETRGLLCERADDHVLVNCAANWQVEPGRAWDYQARVEAGGYTDYDTGYSFHGPHVVTATQKLANVLVLVANSQSGVLISENPESPRHNATCFDRVTTIKKSEGKVLGDVMLLEDTDVDGDVVWLYHEWWYGQGPGRYEFLGGTGKWEGIAGLGTTLGMVQRRADDHYMPTWEMHWKLS